MAAPLAAIPVGGTTIASAGIFEGARRSLPRAASRVSGWLGRNTGRAGAAGGGALGGFGIASIMDRLGIQDDRLRKVTTLGVILAIVVAVGQLVDINLGGS